MKTANINRLSRIIEHYKAIDTIFDSLIKYTDGDEFIQQGGTSIRVYSLLREAQVEANEQRLWLSRKLKVIKEDSNKTNDK